ncbi:HEAT repeat domain-containing protein [Thermodesulfobacteriota bacterium]
MEKRNYIKKFRLPGKVDRLEIVESRVSLDGKCIELFGDFGLKTFNIETKRWRSDSTVGSQCAGFIKRECGILPPYVVITDEFLCALSNGFNKESMLYIIRKNSHKFNEKNYKIIRKGKFALIDHLKKTDNCKELTAIAGSNDRIFLSFSNVIAEFRDIKGLFSTLSEDLDSSKVFEVYFPATLDYKSPKVLPHAFHKPPASFEYCEDFPGTWILMKNNSHIYALEDVFTKYLIDLTCSKVISKGIKQNMYYPFIVRTVLDPDNLQSLCNLIDIARFCKYIEELPVFIHENFKGDLWMVSYDGVYLFSNEYRTKDDDWARLWHKMEKLISHLDSSFSPIIYRLNGKRAKRFFIQKNLEDPFYDSEATLMNLAKKNPDEFLDQLRQYFTSGKLDDLPYFRHRIFVDSINSLGRKGAEFVLEALASDVPYFSLFGAGSLEHLVFFTNYIVKSDDDEPLIVASRNYDAFLENAIDIIREKLVCGTAPVKCSLLSMICSCELSNFDQEIIKLAGDPNAEVRTSVARALTKLQIDREVLIRLANDDSEQVKRDALQGVVGSCDRRVVEAARIALKSEDIFLVNNAVAVICSSRSDGYFEDILLAYLIFYISQNRNDTQTIAWEKILYYIWGNLIPEVESKDSINLTFFKLGSYEIVDLISEIDSIDVESIAYSVKAGNGFLKHLAEAFVLVFYVGALFQTPQDLDEKGIAALSILEKLSRKLSTFSAFKFVSSNLFEHLYQKAKYSFRVEQRIAFLLSGLTKDNYPYLEHLSAGLVFSPCWERHSPQLYKLAEKILRKSSDNANFDLAFLSQTALVHLDSKKYKARFENMLEDNRYRNWQKLVRLAETVAEDSSQIGSIK